jgi:hypothetical protein
MELSELHALYSEALDATTEQRRQIDDDLSFTDVSEPEQWDENLKQKRLNDPGGARPCLVFDQCGQYIQNVTGQVEQRPPAMHAVPVEKGDKRVAQQYDGIFRHIEAASRAQQHYARAMQSAARAGVGYLMIEPDYTNRALNYQEPRIGSEGDPLRVVFDPWSVELDGCDANFAFHVTPLSQREFRRRYGEKKAASSWQEPDRIIRDERESILIARYWRVDEASQNMIVCTMPSGEQVALAEDDYWRESQNLGVNLPVNGTFRDKVRKVYTGLVSGADYLEAEREFPCSYIGVVPVYGYVSFSEGRMRYCGIGRRAMEPQRAYNFHMSEIRALQAAAPRSPWMTPVRAIQGLEAIWDKANAETRAYLPYNDVDENGQPIAMPARSQVSINLANHMTGAEQALRDIQASIGMYQANLGAPSNETSGIAISERKAQGEASTANFPANLAAAIGQIGKIIIDMTPRLMDTRRQIRILGIDSTPGEVIIDPEQAEAVQETPQGLSINPNVGKYDVRVTVGASFATQRSQASQQFTEIMRAAPQMMPAIAPLWAQTLDIPHADKLAQVLTAIAPPEVRAVLQPESKDKPSADQLIMQVEQLQAALKEAITVAEEAEREAAEANAKLQEADDSNAIKAYEAETKRLQALGSAVTPEQVQAIVVQTVGQMMTNPDPMPEEEIEEPIPNEFEGQEFPAEFMPTN